MAGIITKGGGEFVLHFRTTVALTTAIGLLAACSITPSDGPSSASYNKAAAERVTGSNPDGSKQDLPFVLVDLDAKSVETLKQTEKTNYFKGSFTDRRAAADIRIGFGDVISVTIFEAGTGGLFVPTGGTLSGGNYVSIPEQEVDRTGTITIPYAAENNDGGVIKVYNRRPVDVQAEIERRLANRAIEPQVIVNVAERNSNKFSIVGDVGSPGQLDVPHGGIRLLDAITQAGGSEGTNFETLVTLQRGSKTATARLSTLITEPENNIYIRPNDIISIETEERFYNIMGSVGGVGRVEFDADEVNLADALARAGGLSGQDADAQSVLIYRREEPATMKEIGASLEGFKWRPEIPTVFRLDMTDPDGFFLAQNTPIRHDDIIYVSSHPLNEVSKVLTLVRDILLIRLIDN